MRMADGVGLSTPPEVGHDAAALGGGTGDEEPLVSTTGTEEPPPPPEDAEPARVEEEGKGAAVTLEGSSPAVIAVEGEEEVRGEGNKEAEAEAAAAAEEEDEGVKWLGLYSSALAILIVGDGDFSFSLALATAFGSGANLVATSLDTYEDLKHKYSKAESNVMELKRLGATVLHGVDAKKMRLNTDLKNRWFDRIIFNFPHGGFKGKEDDLHMINLHKELVLGFFRNARRLVRPLGEVHVTHKTGEPYDSWDLKHLASDSSLAMVEKVNFRKEDYPGYNQKRGDGKRSDEPFDLGACCTFRFQIGNFKKLKQMNRKRYGLIPNLGGCNVHPGHWVTDRGLFDPVAPVEAWPLHHFPPPAHTGHMLMPPQRYIVDQWQQPGFPLQSDGMAAGPYLHKQESCHPTVSMPGPWMNGLPAQGGIHPPLPIPPPIPMGTPPPIPIPPPIPMGIPPPMPMGRFPFLGLLARQEQPWYQHRTIPDQLGGDDYFFAREHQMIMQREYEMQRQVIPAATGLTYNAFLEHHHWDRESVENLEWMHWMIALNGGK